MSAELLKLENITKSFSIPDSKEKLEILKDINLTLFEGEAISIRGKSGSGKSTLLSIAALLTRATSGTIYYSGQSVDSFTDSSLSLLRNRNMGFVFQSSMLLEDFSALENVAMPLLIRGEKKKDALERAEYYLRMVGMENRMQYRPKLLSGGERQRVAIARALSPSSSIVFADEPTGSLDEETSKTIERLLFDTVRKEKRGLLLVTHNPSFAKNADICYCLENGVLNEE